MIHQIFLPEVAAVFHLVMNTVPRLNADERRMLAVGGPDAHAGRLHINGYRRLSVFVEQSHLLLAGCRQ